MTQLTPPDPTKTETVKCPHCPNEFEVEAGTTDLLIRKFNSETACVECHELVRDDEWIVEVVS